MVLRNKKHLYLSPQKDNDSLPNIDRLITLQLKLTFLIVLEI